MIKQDDNSVSLQSGDTMLQWTRGTEEWRLEVNGLSALGTWITLASETVQSGYRAYLEGPISWRERKYRIPYWVKPEIAGGSSVHWHFDQGIGGNTVTTDARFRTDTAPGISFDISFSLDRDTIRPHFGYSLTVANDKPIDDYAWIQSPSQAGITDTEANTTLWMISTYNRGTGVSRFDGCQALFAKKESPQSMIVSIKLPPAYTDFDSENLLVKGNPVSIHGALISSPATYYQSFPLVLSRQALEPLPPRYSYRKHIDLVLDTLRDPRKWKQEAEGIIYYCVVQGDPFSHRYTLARDREGPGWGGSWDLEMIYMFHQYDSLYSDRSLSAFIKDHTKNMLNGWINNPAFRMGKELTWRKPGDMRDSFVAAKMLNGPTHPDEETDVIWTCHNAYMIYYLSKIYSLAGDERYLTHAISIAEWFFRMRKEDGSVPTLWTLDGCKATMTHGFQAGSCTFMISALLELWLHTKSDRYRQAALQLADFAYAQLTPAFPRWGQGELDWIPQNANAVDPTGVSYIIWGFSDAYDVTGDERYREIVDSFANILLCMFSLWEPHEELLRGSDKISAGSHGMDLKFAGGVACGTWSFYGDLLMNRNEIGDALLRAYEVTGKEMYRSFLVAYMHWHMYFQFTNEVPEEPVSTLGSCPQNHFWTRSYPCFNNDWGCTAAKNASLMMKLIERGIIAEETSHGNNYQ